MAGPAANVPIAFRETKTCAQTPASPATRLTAATPNSRSPMNAIASPSPNRIQRRRGGAALVRRLDRLPFAGADRRRKTPRDLRIWGCGAHHRPGCALPGTQRICLHSARRPRSASNLPKRWARTGQARPTSVRLRNLDAAIIFAPVGALVPAALAAVRTGGTVVCGGIHMSDIPSFRYDLLWGERTLCSIANLTRKDAAEFMAIAPKVPDTFDDPAIPARTGKRSTGSA